MRSIQPAQAVSPEPGLSLQSADASPLIVAVTQATVQGPATTAGEVTAPITLTNANAMTNAGEQFIAHSPTVAVKLDMQKVEATSVAVAVALTWLAVASRQGKQLSLSNLSSDFSGVIEFSGISSMFAEHISSGSRAS